MPSICALRVLAGHRLLQLTLDTQETFSLDVAVLRPMGDPPAEAVSSQLWSVYPADESLDPDWYFVFDDGVRQRHRSADLCALLQAQGERQSA